MSEIDGEKAIRSYLLGELSEDERELLEKRLLADEGYFQQLLLIEQDLIDDYLVDELSPEERARFDGYFLSVPERRQQLRFAKAFNKYAASSALKTSPRVAASSQHLSPLKAFFLSLRPARPALLFALAAILALIIGGFWFIRQRSQPGTVATGNQPAAPTPAPQPSQIPNQNEGEIVTQVTPTPPTNIAVPTPIPTATNESPKSSVMIVALASGLTRGDGNLRRVKVPPATSVVRLRLELDPRSDDYESYRAVLQSASGQELLNRDGLRAGVSARIKMVVLDVPARLLKRDDYYLRLSGQNSEKEFESAGSYSFRIIE
jgi:hypothetical protein